MKLMTTTVRKKDNVVAITLLMAACRNKLTGNCCKIGLLNKFMDILKKLIINPWHLMKPFTNISTETKKREATCMSILGERENIDIIGPTPINAGDKFRTGGVLVKGLIL